MKKNNELKHTPSILIVDDIAANLKILGDILEDIGYKIRPVLNGMQALQVAEKEKPDLILLDIMMPNIDGYEVCRRLKENKNLCDIPVIFISALNDTSDIVKALTVGGADYISKPFKAAEVTARIATHIKIHQQNQELKRLNADKDRFIAILAHDLKNPFNALLGLSEVLFKEISKLSNDEIVEFANHINTSAKNTYNLLEDLLMWAISQSGKLPYNPQQLNITRVCNNIIEDLKLNASNKNITINSSSDNQINLFADLNMLKTILRNLVSNAIKFTHNGGCININVMQNETNTIISVIDNGIGIDSGKLTKLFDISQSQTTTGTADELGTGLGLILCKEFVEKHGGKIWVESEKEKGSTFYFTIPLK